MHRLIGALVVIAVFTLAPIVRAEDPPLFVLSWGEVGTGDGQFNAAGPFGIAVDRNDCVVYVADNKHDRVQKFDTDGAVLPSWTVSVDRPRGIGVDKDGNVYVTGQRDGAIRKFDSDGNLLLMWGTGAAGDPPLGRPVSIAIDEDGYVYVCETNNSRVMVFDANGVWVREWGTGGIGEGQFRLPTGVALDSAGEVYVTDANNRRVQVFDKGGTFQREWGSVGDLDGEFGDFTFDPRFGGPSELAIDGEDNIFVVDPGNSRIQKFDKNGIFLSKWGNFGAGAGQFDWPIGIDVDCGGNVYVTERDNVRVQKFGVPGCGTAVVDGHVRANEIGVAGVTVKLLDDLDPTIIIDDTSTGADGSYVFGSVPLGTAYQVMLVEWLGYDADQNDVALSPKDLSCGGTSSVDFVLTPFVVVNDARSKGYWKHQFDVYVKGRGNAQETDTQLSMYIDEVRDRYTDPYYQTIFAGMADGSIEPTTDFEEWQAALSVRGNAGMEAKATAQLAALALNVMSLKIGQYELVTDDERTAGDVLTYSSQLLTPGDFDPELAKDLAESVNNQETIAAGIVPEGGIQYRGPIPDLEDVPSVTTLRGTAPNPSQLSTLVSYDLASEETVQLTVYNVAGQEVAVLVDRVQTGGRYSVSWDGRDRHGRPVGSGLYLVRLQTGRVSETKSMILAR